MSKSNPNQDYYKIGGREQSDGLDRGNAGYDSAQGKSKGRDPEKNRGKEGQPNFIPGEAPVGESKKD
jgi:hypothetical protein